MKKPVVLRIFKGDQLFGVKQFQEEQIVIGREPSGQLALDDDKVAPIHALIEERDSGHYVCDLGSETGTFRNGEQVLDAKLESGDLIQIGGFRIEFFVGVPKPKSVPPTNVEKPISPPASIKVPEGPPVVPVVAEPPPPAKPITRPAEPAKPFVFTTAPVALDLGGGPARSARAATRSRVKKEKTRKTFAPPSKYKSLNEYIKPSKGTVVEVLVAWRERVINTYHFSGSRVVTMGSHPDSDIVLPLMVSKAKKIPILKLDARPMVLVVPEISGELVRGQQASSFAELLRQNRMVKDAGSGLYVLALEQGEMVRFELGDQVSVIIRFTSDSPKPMIAPWLDLTASEVTAVLLSVALMGVIAFYLYLNSPPPILEPEGKVEDPVRTALLLKAPPRPIPIPPEPVASPAPTPIPTPVAKSTPTPVKLDVKTQAANQKAQNNRSQGAASNVAPNKNLNKPKEMTSVKQGGAVKTTDKEGAQMKTQPKKDVTKQGIFTVFGGGGKQDEMSQSTNGAGELAGMAGQSSGKAGQADNRPGAGLGSQFKDTGRGGTGTAMVGVAGVNTRGRGGGASGYGTGGLGQRTGVRVMPGGAGESFSGTIDREAIRRVVQQNLRTIKACYERQLNRNPDLAGKILLEWDIGEQGRVIGTRVNSGAPGFEGVGECILDRLKTWRFPEPPSNQSVTVIYPFVFE